MDKRSHYRTFREVEAEYFLKNPEEIDPYMREIFDSYAEDKDSAALLASLRVIAQVKGMTNIAQATGMTRQGVQNALSSKGNPRFDNINTMLHTMGYRLIPAPIQTMQEA
jgi:probable addiction module antidote protein